MPPQRASNCIPCRPATRWICVVTYALVKSSAAGIVGEPKISAPGASKIRSGPSKAPAIPEWPVACPLPRRWTASRVCTNPPGGFGAPAPWRRRCLFRRDYESRMPAGPPPAGGIGFLSERLLEAYILVQWRLCTNSTDTRVSISRDHTLLGRETTLR